MAKLELFYPVRPYRVNQPWGVYDDLYKQFGFTQHNGIDIALVNGQPIHAPFDCSVVRIGNQPQGGGIFVGLLSKNTYTFPDGITCFVLIDLLHCQMIKVMDGQSVRVGDVVALGDNTGLSTGQHLHMQCRRVQMIGRDMVDVDRNGANNTFDQSKYWTGVYADTWVLLRLAQAQLAKLLALFGR